MWIMDVPLHLGAGQHYKATRSVTLQFSVEHYAGPVKYDVSGWIAKNRDVLTPSVMSVLQESSNDLVRQLFSATQTLTGGLDMNETAGRMAERQENARELIQVRKNFFFFFLGFAECTTRFRDPCQYLTPSPSVDSAQVGVGQRG